MISFIVILSFYLEGILSKLISIKFLVPEFTIISLIIIYPFLHNDYKLYYKICFITGLLYDIAYTDTLFLNAFCFLILGYIIKKINIVLTNNIFNISLISIIIITINRLLIYLVLIFINYINPNFNILLFSIVNSLLINIIYAIILFKITDIISNKKGIYKIY